jgi:hypothetical protein
MLGMPVKRSKVQLGIALSDKLQAEEGLLNNYLTLEPGYSIGSMELYEAFVKLMRGCCARDIPGNGLT